jgi:hypothetical protein
MVSKTITLRFSNGYNETVSMVCLSEAHFAKKVFNLMKERGAYGFGLRRSIDWCKVNNDCGKVRS